MGTSGYRQKLDSIRFKSRLYSLKETQISVENRINAFVKDVVDTVKTAFAAPMYNFNFA